MVSNIRIRCKIANEGSPNNVVFMHGMAFNADTWDDLGTLDLVAKEGFGVYALDLPGFGKSSGTRLKRKQATEFIRTFLDEMMLEKCVLVGPSMGGGIALSYAVKYGDKLTGLVLIAPAGLDDPEIINNLTKISVPVLIFWGENDKIFPVEMGKNLAKKLRNSEFVICPKARHPCYLDCPELFHEKLIAFVKSVFSER